jgi:60 kDa SS-A/Ro ribonucleoprotein
MTRYSTHVSNLSTPQREKARPDQVENNAGGFVFQLDCWQRLDRFLVLGTEGGTYYAGEKEHTIQASKAVEECIRADGPRTVARIVEISDGGRAPKNDPAIFALAMCAGADGPATRQAALAALPKVCRIGTHLFHFAADVEYFRRWGRSLRTAVAKWYNDKTASDLAYDCIKYQQRDGWAHRDVLRLAHPTPKTPEHAAIMRYVTVGMAGMSEKREKHARDKAHDKDKLPAIIAAFEEIHSAGVTPGRAARLISEFRLPHECVPNEMKNEKIVWEALLEHIGPTALIRNLGKLSSLGMTKPMGEHTKLIAEKLADKAALKKGRVHPMTVLYAMKTYAGGHGLKGSLSWTPERAVVDALDDAFYASFDVIEPTGKATFLALDVSGSMGTPIGGTSLTCREASAAMAMVTARAEKNWACVGFTSGGRGYGGMHGGDPSGVTELKVSPRQRLDDVVKAISGLPFGGTDCALPMLHATKHNLAVDVFHVYTDNETWAGAVHPFQALEQYRQKSGRDAKICVVGMTATEYTIAQPGSEWMKDVGKNPRSLNVIGFDTTAPSIMAEFARG